MTDRTAAPPTSELAAFIEARLGDWERDALAATPGPWGYGEPRQTEESPWPTTSVWTGEAGNAHTEADNEADATHIARHDPARVLAQVAAIRAVAAMHIVIHGYCDGCGMETQSPDGCMNLRALAAIWADHEDWQEEWRA